MDIKVWYLCHSGFAVETRNHFLVFDYWKDKPENGTLADGVIEPSSLAEKDVIVFSSHNHEDHFNPVIFKWREKIPRIRYVLSSDITIPSSISDTCEVIWADKSKVYEQKDFSFRTLASTDEGVAFLIEIDEGCIYHAGDLNWWHWEGEPDPYNQDMARDYKAQIDLLREKKIDLAFVPVDPRLEQQYSWGIDYLIKTAEIEYAIPMHFWDKPEIVLKLLADPAASEYKNKICPLLLRGESIQISTKY